MKKTAIFSISSLGLGHATRTLPVLKSYIPGHRIHIVCHGNALLYLKKEFGGSTTDTTKNETGSTVETDIVFHDAADYPPIERGAGKGWKFYWYLLFDSVHTVFVIRKEHAFVEELAKKVRPEFIFSDGRYGSYAKGVPSFILCHQISFIMPKRFHFLQGITDRFNRNTFANFDAVFIPDYAPFEESLGGKLSHHPLLSGLHHHYVGILSSLVKSEEKKDGTKEHAKDIDFLFTVSGYLSEHKDSFVDILIEQAKSLPGKKVFILGESKEDFKKTHPEHGIEIYSSASGEFRRELFNRAKFVVSRAGYTTIMDLVELDLPGLLIPTPGQTEQEYLAPLHGKKGDFLFQPADHIDLGSIGIVDIHGKNFPETGRFKAAWKSSTTIEKIRNTIADTVSGLHRRGR